MQNQEILLELTECYLKTLVADTVTSLGADFDAATPFGELGVDSFRVLKIIKALEGDFGVLPKTLLFENFNVESLGRFFVEKYAPALSLKFAGAQLADLSTVAPALPAPHSPAAIAPTHPVALQPASTPQAALSVRQPVRLLEKDLPLYPQLDALARELFERHKNEGAVSRGTRNIAPNLFFGSAQKGYFNYSRSNHIILVYAYTGPEDYFPEIAAEMSRYCADKNFQLNIFGDRVLGEIDGTPFSATPFGALQRVLDIQDFTLEGGPMRRLRYQVAKFEKAGACRTAEYKCGSDPAVDAAIAGVIDAWCASRSMVNPLIHIVREEILAGSLHPQHRIFLTSLDDKLQNVILISAMSATLNGYLMDLEFYGKDMPLGGLEFAIVRIIETLAAEGCGMLSLGGTYGCRLETSPHADPEVDAILDELHAQNIFSDDGNLQFKNKFRPENRTIYLCRPAGGANSNNVIDLIMMIADPAKAQTSEADNHNAGAAQAATAVAAVPVAPVLAASPVAPVPAAGAAIAAAPAVQLPAGEARAPALVEGGFNPHNIADDKIEFDLKTDSWAQLGAAPFITRQMAHLSAQLQQPVNVNDSLASLFPFQHFVLTDAGRSADHLFCKAWEKKGIVPQNLLFPTCIYHQIENGFTPHELPHPSVFQSDGDGAARSGIDLDALRALVSRRAADIAYVCIEVSDNASGGQPVTVEHLAQVREILAPHAIALVIDATRILENAQFLIERDPQHAGHSMWNVARAVLSHADAVIGSLAKDFSVNKGGLIATNNQQLMSKLQELVRQEGGGLNVVEKKLIGLALQQRAPIEAAVLRRMRAVESLWRTLKQAGIPVVGPAGAHCVLIDVKQVPELACAAHPVPAFLAWLYLHCGIRAGAHSVGMQKDTAINGLVRLAIPVGLKAAQVEEIGLRLVRTFREKRLIPVLQLRGASTDAFGGLHDNYDLLAWHGQEALPAPAAPPAQPACAAPVAAPVAKQVAAAATAPVPAPVQAPAPAAAPVSSTARGDIAVVGMAGRYPKAVNMAEFWDNLKSGRDCIGELPPERLARRVRTDFSQTYRGGFIDNVDKFDSLFFNISPREAEVLDPQERLFLEVAWETLEDAGYYPELLAQEASRRNVGVFVGAVWAMYQMAGVEQKLAGNNLNPNSFLWSISNRVSYWMNFTGPSMTVDTACSSSLTAMYLACEAIRRGDCSSAIVGGVNLDLHQHKFDINNAGGALSPDGVCRTFGAGANGYVAGEGVGAVFLKPLEQALADNDHIYGVIKSAVVNHGGRTSGYTVPIPQAQGELITAALAKAGVDARSIGYIEAHGTGTELGDPVEISGLARAFEIDKVGAQHCAIGSVKTNIGHLEAGAGVAGVCKVLLQMQHRQLVPSLHSAELNEHIDFAASPFRVQQALEEWTGQEVDGVRQPLRAGISSFGAGGANAHLVLEQFSQAAAESGAAEPEGAHIFPLSARTDDQLQAMARRLRQHLAQGTGQRLADIAFTLQNGRKSFEHRLAIVAASGAELARKLDLWLEQGKHADILCGHAKNSDGITKLLSRREKEQFVSLLAQSREPRKLAQLWIDGLLADCRGIAQGGGRRTSLPTYPFADKRHWIGEPEAAAQRSAPRAGAGVHPLIDSNESTFQRQVFRKAFYENEFFLRDHVVSNVPTLPGTVYLDMARKAGEIATGRAVASIRNITWVSPLTASGPHPTDALIELKPAADAVHFDVFSEAGGQRKLYAQGKLVFGASAAAAASVEPTHIDLAAIRARCPVTIAAADAYPLFRQFGMQYGPSFQVLQEVFANQDEVLGLLRLPDVRGADFQDYLLHPCLLDASMQAGVVGQLGAKSGQMKVPYSIGEVELLHPLTPVCYSYVTKVKNARSASSGLSRENVTIVDQDGKVLVRIRDSVGVPLSSVHDKPAQAAQEEQFQEQFPLLHYSHVWQPSQLAAAPAALGSLLLFDTDDRLRSACAGRGVDTVLVLPGEQFEALGNGVYRLDPLQRSGHARLLSLLAERGWTPAKVCYNWAVPAQPQERSELAQALERGVYGFLAFCQALIEQKPAARVQMLYLYASGDKLCQPHNEAVNGFARSLRLENPKLDCKVLEMRGPGIDAQMVLAALEAELDSATQDQASVRYEGRVRYARTLQKLGAPELDAAAARGMAFKEDGVYLITGGAGGLGLIFAAFLARQCKVRLVLTGRSALPEAARPHIDALRERGAEVVYIAGDIATAAGAGDVLAQARACFGRIDGIIHAAGVLRDSFLRNKSAEEMDAVFAPKIFGTFELDRQSAADDLDFFVTFSSLAAIGGNTGQCDYAFANHYMDSFAAAREAQRALGRRSGRSLSLNWSLWADGGMKLDEQTELFFRKSLGIKPLATEVGLQAFARALMLERPQVAVLEAVQAKIEQAWGLTRKEVPAPAPAVQAAASAVQGAGAPGAADLPARVVQELSQTVMDLLKIGAADLSQDAILLDLGFDSIGLTSFANAINARYGIDINPVMFFEYPSLRAIAGVLAAEHAAAVQQVHQPGQASAVAGPAPAAPVSVPAEPTFAIDKQWTPPAQAVQGTGFSRARRFSDVPIAIVGIGGVMPQSDNLEQFWDNLKNERNLVTDIPRERWTWEQYHGNPVKERNKSNSKWGGFMKEVDKFDPLFFGMTPREAEMMDPQQRIFIETVYSAIEDSGHKVSDLSGTKTGLFVGVSAKDYIDVLAENEASLDGFSASGNSHSILANRISFLFNLRGPSAPLDTACSSSLVALHRAIESIHTGSSDMAIVGGVQVMLTPIAHISLSSAGMLSIDGKCKTFDKDANGYVRGEGSGAIFIKTLAQAEADGNPIYAVIKASAENHGGRVTMLTAPNPKAQAELLFEAYHKAGIDPGTVGYIECHGTGTSLGDPIEIQALKKTFADLYQQHGRAAPLVPHCGLSSVKTNIGHLEPAAGIASLLKVLLSIKNKAIPALLHFDTLNPYIDLKGSPFYIVDKTTEWQAPLGPDGAELPRRAGVSSFGWGGANAHIVLEEYVAPQRPALQAPQAPVPIVLSARNEERLKAYARALLSHIEHHAPDLSDLSYTLQVGRDPMDVRLGMVVNSVPQLKLLLEAFAATGVVGEGMHYGKVNRFKRNDQGLSVIDAPGAAASPNDIAEWIATLNHARLVVSWVEGAEVNWSRLNHTQPGGFKARRISLPTYPFARDRHWIDTSGAGKQAGQGGATAQLHPLLHSNSSTLRQHSYTSTFSGMESFLLDHAGALPSAAYLEMARAAVTLARPGGAAAMVELRAVEWAPLALPVKNQAVTVSVFEARAGQFELEIHTDEPAADGALRKFIHCHCSATFDHAPAPARVDIGQLKSLISHTVLDAAGADLLLAHLTPRRGPSLQAVKALHRSGGQLLAHLVLPAQGSGAGYVLQPALLDSALQCALALAADFHPLPGQGSIPAALKLLRVLAPCTADMYAWVRHARGSDAGARHPKLDIDLVDSEGTLCIRLKGLAFSVERPAPEPAGPARDGDFARLLDAIYDAGQGPHAAPAATAGASSEIEFEQMLEKILKG